MSHKERALYLTETRRILTDLKKKHILFMNSCCMHSW